MSPEQREGRPATVKSDLYGVGAILWEMLTGEPPGAEGAAPRVRPSGVHRDLDAKHDRLVLSMLATDPATRPDDAFAARRALASLEWPASVDRIAAPRSERRRESDRPSAMRLLETSDRDFDVDQWLGRRVARVPLDAATLARASAFARANHPALQAVLRVDRESASIWLAAPRGAPLAGPLSDAQRTTLRDALGALHELGHVHGAVDRDHVFVDDGDAVLLAWAPPPPPAVTSDLDRLALARL